MSTFATVSWEQAAAAQRQRRKQEKEEEKKRMSRGASGMNLMATAHSRNVFSTGGSSYGSCQRASGDLFSAFLMVEREWGNKSENQEATEAAQLGELQQIEAPQEKTSIHLLAVVRKAGGGGGKSLGVWLPQSLRTILQKTADLVPESRSR